MEKINPFVFRRFPFRPRVKSNSVFPGPFRSNLSGQGQEFYSLRPYQFGDDARKIHWKGYARTGELYTREDVAESNARIWVVRDLSTSMEFGGKPALITGFSAFIENFLLEGSNSVGCIACSDKIHFFHKPQTGHRAIRSTRILLRDMEAIKGSIMDVSLACGLLGKHTRRGDVVFLLSDFVSGKDLTTPLSALALNLEVIPVVIRDPRENMDRAYEARISFRDMETEKALAPSQGTVLKKYDERLKEFFFDLSLDSLWMEGAHYNDAINCIIGWLSRRNKIR